MKVYVDELPKSCKECPFFVYYEHRDEYYCRANGEGLFDKCKKLDNCPLHSLSDYTKQVRKEVIEKLKIESPYCHINCEDYYKVYPEILEKIIGETNAKD